MILTLRKLMLVTAALACLLTLKAGAQVIDDVASPGTFRPDGYWWQKLTAKEQIVALQLGYSAYFFGWANSSARALKDIEDATTFRTAFKHAAPGNMPFTFSVYRDKINAFYSARPSKRNILVSAVLACTFDPPLALCADLLGL